MATSKSFNVKLAASDYQLLKRLASDRKQTMTVVAGLALAEFDAKHGKRRKPARQ